MSNVIKWINEKIINFCFGVCYKNKYNAQYRPITVKVFKDAHDRFLIIDENGVYHIRMSLKDLGKKWFAFSKMDWESLSVLGRLK